MTSGTTEVDQSTLSEEDDVSAGRHGESVDLGLDVDGLDGSLLEPVDVDLDVKVTNVANDSVLGHGREVLASDDVSATGGGNKDVSLGSGFLHGGDLETGHRGLESVDGVDLGNDNSGSVRAERLGATLSDISVTGDDSNLSGEHDVGGTLDTVDEGLSATVQVVELGLGD